MNSPGHDETLAPMLKACLDNELPLLKRLAIQWHLMRCESCKKEFEVMQRIGEEMRGKRIDPLDPLLRSRILATVRTLTPEPIASVRSRAPIYAWGGAATAVLLAIVLIPKLSIYSSPSASDERNAQPSIPASARPAPKSPALPPAGNATGRSLLKRAPSPHSVNSASGSLRASPVQDEESRSSKATMQHEQSDPVLLESNHYADGHRVRSVSPSVPAPPSNAVSDYFGPSASPPDRPANKALAYDRPENKLTTKNGSVAIPQTDLADKNRNVGQNAIAVAKAGFDLNGYEFVTQDGKKIDIPFTKKLDRLRFARAAGGKMLLRLPPSSPGRGPTVLTEELPTLYLIPSDRLTNDAVPGTFWQPLPAGYTPTLPAAILPAPDWEQYVALRWAPGMTIIGGVAKNEKDKSGNYWLPGSRIHIGSKDYNYAAYVNSAAMQNAKRLIAVHGTTGKTLSPAVKAPAQEKLGSPPPVPFGSAKRGN